MPETSTRNSINRIITCNLLTFTEFQIWRYTTNPAKLEFQQDVCKAGL